MGTINREIWSEREDSNLRPPAPEAGALPDCATLRHRLGAAYSHAFRARQALFGWLYGPPLLGRRQAVRQRILIPPFGGSIPPAPANPPTSNHENDSRRRTLRHFRGLDGTAGGMHAGETNLALWLIDFTRKVSAAPNSGYGAQCRASCQGSEPLPTDASRMRLTVGVGFRPAGRRAALPRKRAVGRPS